MPSVCLSYILSMRLVVSINTSVSQEEPIANVALETSPKAGFFWIKVAKNG